MECNICYSNIFHHDSLSVRLGPLAFQCSLCQQNLICNSCQTQLKTCPFCKRRESMIEPASEIILNEIKKLKFKCQFNVNG